MFCFRSTICKSGWDAGNIQSSQWAADDEGPGGGTVSAAAFTPAASAGPTAAAANGKSPCHTGRCSVIGKKKELLGRMTERKEGRNAARSNVRIFFSTWIKQMEREDYIFNFIYRMISFSKVHVGACLHKISLKNSPISGS